MNNSNLNEIDPDDNLFNNYYRSMGNSDQSKYYSLRNFNETFSDIQCNLAICNYNIRSFLYEW